MSISGYMVFMMAVYTAVTIWLMVRVDRLEGRMDDRTERSSRDVPDRRL